MLVFFGSDYGSGFSGGGFGGGMGDMGGFDFGLDLEDFILFVNNDDIFFD